MEAPTNAAFGQHILSYLQIAQLLAMYIQLHVSSLVHAYYSKKSVKLLLFLFGHRPTSLPAPSPLLKSTACSSRSGVAPRSKQKATSSIHTKFGSCSSTSRQSPQLRPARFPVRTVFSFAVVESKPDLSDASFGLTDFAIMHLSHLQYRYSAALVSTHGCPSRLQSATHVTPASCE